MMMMKSTDLSEARDPVLRGSIAALRRAAVLARQTAIRTETALVIMEGGRLVRIPAAELRRQSPPQVSPGVVDRP